MQRLDAERDCAISAVSRRATLRHAGFSYAAFAQAVIKRSLTKQPFITARRTVVVSAAREQ